jgi:hypothetical protein
LQIAALNILRRPEGPSRRTQSVYAVLPFGRASFETACCASLLRMLGDEGCRATDLPLRER